LIDDDGGASRILRISRIRSSSRHGFVTKASHPASSRPPRSGPGRGRPAPPPGSWRCDRHAQWQDVKAESSNGVPGRRLRSAAESGAGKNSFRFREAVTSGLPQSSSDTEKREVPDPASPYVPTTTSDVSSAGRGRQIDCEMSRTSPSQCSARCAQSASSARPTPASSSPRRAASSSPSSPGPSSTATRTRGTRCTARSAGT
jgi:hypothetical protein